MGKATLVQLRVPDDLLARIDEAAEGSTRTAWLLEAAERELDGAGPDGTALDAPGVTHKPPAGGIPSHGTVCFWPECWARDTRRFGVTDPGELARTDYAARPRDAEASGLPLCPSHAARLAGLVYRRHARAATLPGA